MKLPSDIPSSKSGFTLIELTLVVAVLLSLIAVTFVGVNAYKEGSNRANCIQNVVVTQQAVRAFGNLYEVKPGEPIADLLDKLIGQGKFIPTTPSCPSSGEYSFANEGTVLPEYGTAFLQCSIESHEYSGQEGW
ncbi:MAG: type II secretion system GspH family protein [Verrucomicrobiales bacterium]|nr:type II secretion system GspH family protein [Verrucomicrobiales bacterium]